MSRPVCLIARETGAVPLECLFECKRGCAKGCGPCSVKTIDFVWREVHDRNGKLLEQNTTPVDVSACCGADLMLWDEGRQEFVEFDLIVRPGPANVALSR